MGQVRKDGQGTERRQRSKLMAIRFTPEERIQLEARADAAGLSIGAYIRHQALGIAGPRSVNRLPVDALVVRQLIGQLGSVGNNLNQLTRLANLGDLEEPRELDPVLRRVNEIVDACMAALGRRP